MTDGESCGLHSYFYGRSLYSGFLAVGSKLSQTDVHCADPGYTVGDGWLERLLRRRVGRKWERETCAAEKTEERFVLYRSRGASISPVAIHRMHPS
jgi:hypothetical protein